jgi:hypothetical protein
MHHSISLSMISAILAPEPNKEPEYNMLRHNRLLYSYSVTRILNKGNILYRLSLSERETVGYCLVKNLIKEIIFIGSFPNQFYEHGYPERCFCYVMPSSFS